MARQADAVVLADVQSPMARFRDLCGLERGRERRSHLTLLPVSWRTPPLFRVFRGQCRLLDERRRHARQLPRLPSLPRGARASRPGRLACQRFRRRQRGCRRRRQRPEQRSLCRCRRRSFERHRRSCGIDHNACLRAKLLDQVHAPVEMASCLRVERKSCSRRRARTPLRTARALRPSDEDRVACWRFV